MTDIIKKQKLKHFMEILEEITFDDLSESDQKTIFKHLTIDKIKEEVKEKAKINQFDLKSEIELFLSKYSSSATIRSYQGSINLYIQFLELKKRHILETNYKLVDQFLVYLQNTFNFSNKSIRNKIAGISAFLSALERYQEISKNYFKGCKLPKAINVKHHKQIPTTEEIETIIDSYHQDLNFEGRGQYKKRLNAKKMMIAIDLMRYQGFRVGALEELVIDLKKERYDTHSKSKRITGKLSPEIIKLLLKEGDFAFNSETIRKNFYAKTTMLYEEGSINYNYSVHSLRHYFAIHLYKDTKDIYLVKDRLHHANISITETYLRSLEMI